jgi:hypothetical protein
MESGSPCGENRTIFTIREIKPKVRLLKHSRLQDWSQVNRKRFPEMYLRVLLLENTDCSL